MSSIAKAIIGLCFFRGGVQDLPASMQWVILSGLLAVFAYVITSPISQGFGSIVAVAVAQVAFLGLIVRFMLKIKNKPERWLQTTTALYGTGIVVQLAGWPFTRWYDRVKDIPEEMGFPFMVIVILGFWYLLIMASILKQALEVGTGQSLLLSFMCQALLVAMLFTLFGSTIFQPA